MIPLMSSNHHVDNYQTLKSTRKNAGGLPRYNDSALCEEIRETFRRLDRRLQYLIKSG
jgi:hypothetical protein